VKASAPSYTYSFGMGANGSSDYWNICKFHIILRVAQRSLFQGCTLVQKATTCIKVIAMALQLAQIPPHQQVRTFVSSICSFVSVQRKHLTFRFWPTSLVVRLQHNHNTHPDRISQSTFSIATSAPSSSSYLSYPACLFMINMPKAEKAPPTQRSSISTASAAGAGSRSSTWSARDDETLIQARAQGLNWNQISPKHFPQKSANACRKRHERLMERQNAEQWDGVKLDVLAQAYMEVRREMWSKLGALVGEKWQLVEQKVRCAIYICCISTDLLFSAWRRDSRI
jgi:hypothetical protein